MKYIRTKDGRIVFTTILKKYENDEKTFNWFINNCCGGKLNVVKVADTIEELCDMFVVWQEGCDMPVDMPLTEKERYNEMKKLVCDGMKAKLNVWLKVAIWTEKGLVYVAKLNDKGELELLWAKN